MLHLGSIRRTTIDVDISFLILVGFFVVLNLDTMGMPYALLWFPVAFVSVLLHELAHAAVIGLFGYGSSRVLLAGMGGLTINERAARPGHNVLISLAGPLASFGIAAIAWLIYLNVDYVHRDPALAAFLPFLARVNVLWALLNALPLRPLDGGNALHNFFRMFLDEGTAFNTASVIGMITGVGVVAWAVYTKSVMLAVIVAWFTFINFQQWQASRSSGPPTD